MTSRREMAAEAGLTAGELRAIENRSFEAANNAIKYGMDVEDALQLAADVGVEMFRQLMAGKRAEAVAGAVVEIHRVECGPGGCVCVPAGATR